MGINQETWVWMANHGAFRNAEQKSQVPRGPQRSPSSPAAVAALSGPNNRSLDSSHLLLRMWTLSFLGWSWTSNHGMGIKQESRNSISTHLHTHTHTNVLHVRCRLTASSHVCLYDCKSVYLYVCMSVYLYVCMSVCMYVCMSVSLYVCMSVCISVCGYMLHFNT